MENSGSSERKPKSPRPESTMALTFSDVLDGAFGLTPEIEELNDTVEQKKQNLTSQNQELVELEARIRAAENRLAQAEGKKVSNSNSSGARDTNATSSSSGDYARHPSANDGLMSRAARMAENPSSNDSMTNRASRTAENSRVSGSGSSPQSPRVRRNTRDK